MKKVFTLAIAGLFSIAIIAPAFATAVTTAEESAENVNRGAKNVDWAWTEVMQHSGEEAGKAEGIGAQSLGVFAGGIIGARKGIHRLGAGAIDLLTFWIPKENTLLDDTADPLMQ